MLIAPSGAVESALSQLELNPEEHSVVVATRTAVDADVRSIVISPVLRALSVRVGRMLGGSAAGRNLLRLSPLDDGRRFAGAALRNPAFRSAVSTVDLFVVLERDGILTGWRALHRLASRDARAVNGIAPARALLAAARA